MSVIYVEIPQWWEKNTYFSQVIAHFFLPTFLDRPFRDENLKQDDKLMSNLVYNYDQWLTKLDNNEVGVPLENHKYINGQNWMN